MARVETEPVSHYEDAADDPAIWIHPSHPESSLVICTDKRGGLIACSFDGIRRQLVSDRSRPDNVDVIYGFPLGGRRTDLALAGCRPRNSQPGVKVWAIDSTGAISDATENEVIPVFGGTDPYGTCLYHSARDGAFYFFVTNKEGQIEQYRLEDAGDGKVAGTRVRSFSVGSIAEGCVADDEQGQLYLSEEQVGIWKFGAEPDAPTQGQLVERVGEHGLTADVEGLTLYYATNGLGYLIASSQGSNTFLIYERGGDNRYVLTIDPRDGPIKKVAHTDGITVISTPISRQFPKGVFIVQDGTDRGVGQNFKLFAWEDIAGARLLVDTGWSPRPRPAPRALPKVATASTNEASRAGEVAGSAEDMEDIPRGRPVGWVESPPLESETAHLAERGAVKLEVGFEREHEIDRSESKALFGLEYAASDRLQLRLEPIVYSEIKQTSGAQASGIGDLEVSATLVALSETGPIPGVAFAAEVKLPTARNQNLGTGRADYTGDVILSKRVAGLYTHLNLGYTVVGKPPGADVRNVFGFALAAERRLERFDVGGEVIGHTGVLRRAGSEAWLASGVVRPELAGEQFAATLGARFHVNDKLVLSLGASYEHDRAFEIEPGVAVRMR
jgi:3-phytase